MPLSVTFVAQKSIKSAWLSPRFSVFFFKIVKGVIFIVEYDTPLEDDIKASTEGEFQKFLLNLSEVGFPCFSYCLQNNTNIFWKNNSSYIFYENMLSCLLTKIPSSNSSNFLGSP